MRELTVRIRFTQPCLGSVKSRGGDGRFYLPRNANGQVIFMSTWHQANLRMAAKVLGRHQDEVNRILWDIAVEGTVRRDAYVRRYYQAGSRQKYVLHEAFLVGQIVGVNCVVPATISDDDFWELLRLSGQYQGLSPYRGSSYGLFAVESILPRRPVAEPIEKESLVTCPMSEDK